MKKTWFFSFDNAPDFIVKVKGKSVKMHSKEVPSEGDRENWVEATRRRAYEHLFEDQWREFDVLCLILKRLDLEKHHG